MPGDIPLAAMESVIREAGASRISQGAKEELRALIKSRCEGVVLQAIRFARHAGRKTVQEEDVELAIEQARNL